jgi:hypothetical protein
MHARLERGSSVLAALILAAFVGGIILSVHTIANNSLAAAPQSQLAADAAAAATPEAPQQCSETADSINKECAAAIVQAKSSGAKTYSPSSPVIKDNCVAAVPDPTKNSLPANDPHKYKCVGKSTRILLNNNGTLTVAWTANSNVKVGVCAVAICKGTSASLFNSSNALKVQCTPIEAQCIDKSTVEAALADPSRVFTFSRSALGTSLTLPQGQQLDDATNKLLNQALGRNPDDTSYTMPIDNNWNFQSPSYKALEDLNAQMGVDQSAQDASKQVTDAAVQLNPELANSQKQDILGPAPDSYGTLGPDGNYYSPNGQLCESQTKCPEPPAEAATIPSSANCRTDGSLCYPTSQADVNTLQGQGYTCTPAGDYSQCVKKGTAPPWSGTPNQPPPNNPGPQTAPPPNNSSGGLSGALGSILKGILPALTNALFAPTPPPATCTSDANAYNSALQQYQQQMYQYNQQLQQYNYQSQIAQMQGYPTPPQPIPPSQPCYTAPSGGGTPSGATGTPTAQISCQPQTVDVGMDIAISFSCGNADSSAGSGFDTGGKTFGSATTTLSNPPAGATAATYSLQCRNRSAATQTQCSVQITRPSIILVANPKIVTAGASSTIGWLTTGMQSCIISSPDSQQFTAENATNKSISGAAVTPPLNSSANFVLSCTTLGGSAKQATTTVQVGTPGSGSGGGISVTSSADGASIARGDTVGVTWSASSPPSGAHAELWLYDVGLQREYALIASDLAASGTYSWATPGQSASCPSGTPYVCYADLVPGRSYAIEGFLFTGASTSPTYIGSGFAPQNFTVSQ